MKELAKDSSFKRIVIIFFLFIAAGLFTPFLLIKSSFLGLGHFQLGQIGDSFSGIISAYIAIGASFLTFIAFWVQYQANKRQWESLSKEKKTNNVHSELSIAFECVKDMRSNIDLVSLNERSGQTALLNEVNYLIDLYINMHKNNSSEDHFPKDVFFINVNYFINSLKYLVSSIENKELDKQYDVYIIRSSNNRLLIRNKLNEAIDKISKSILV